MALFSIQKSIPVGLEEFTLVQAIEVAKAGEFYLESSKHSNHLQFGFNSGRGLYSIHDFEYDDSKKRILLLSKWKKSSFWLYSYSAISLIGLIEDGKINFSVLWIILALFIFLTLILVIGIRSDSKEIEREMTIRINYLRRNKS